jgi:hypothetical protein
MNQVVVPRQLRKPHPLVEATRDFYSDVRPDDDGRMRPGPREAVAHLIVSKAALRQALLYLQAIFAQHGSRHATAWGVAAFLVAGIAVPVYFVRYWTPRAAISTVSGLMSRFTGDESRADPCRCLVTALRRLDHSSNARRCFRRALAALGRLVSFVARHPGVA